MLASLPPRECLQDTIAAPNENVKMRKSATIGISVTTFYYVIIGIVGYAAFGNEAPGNLLTGFGYFEPWWLIMLANLAIVVSILPTACMSAACACASQIMNKHPSGMVLLNA